MKPCHPSCAWSCSRVCFDGLDISADTGRCTTRLTLNSSVIPNNWSLQRFKPFELKSGFLALIPVPCAVMQVVELISGGAQIAVTNENKMHYLNLLAQYRLATQVRDEVEHFLKGKESLSHGWRHRGAQTCVRWTKLPERLQAWMNWFQKTCSPYLMRMS